MPQGHGQSSVISASRMTAASLPPSVEEKTVMSAKLYSGGASFISRSGSRPLGPRSTRPAWFPCGWSREAGNLSGSWAIPDGARRSGVEGGGHRDSELVQGAFLSWEQHAGPSRRRRAVRTSASLRFAEQRRRARDAVARSLTDVSDGGACRDQEHCSRRSSGHSRDLHPICTLREQTPRRPRSVRAHKCLINKE